MSDTLRTASIIGVFLGLIFLTACGSSPPTSTPSPDLDPFRTEVAATVIAQVSQTSSLKFSATPNPSPTTTIAPTSTSTPSATPSPSATGTLPSGTPSTGTENRAQWVSQTIPDNTTFAADETFTMTWRLKNVGTSTWTAAYLLRFYSGNTFGAPKEVPLGQEVLPGATVDISIQMKAPTTPGDYRSDWVLSNEERSNFKDPIFLKITVAAPFTPTPTLAATP